MPLRGRVHSGHPGVAYHQRLIEKAKQLLWLRKKGLHLTYQDIARCCGFRSHRTAQQIAALNMSLTACYSRNKAKGPPRYAKTADEQVIAGCMVYRHHHRLDTSRPSFLRFLHTFMAEQSNASWRCRFMKRQHLSWRTSTGARAS